MKTIDEPTRARLEALLGFSIRDASGRIWTAGELLRLLEAFGIVAYVAGGAVRDAIRAAIPNDLDIVADAHILRVADVVGGACGKAAIQICNEAIGSLRLGADEESHFDIGMFRDIESVEGHCAIGNVAWGQGDLASDASTTDFTVNALYWRPETGIIDPTGRGISDCRAGLLELSSDPRKTAIDHRLSLRFALFVARGFTPTAASLAFFRSRIDPDVARFGDRLPAYLDELTAGSAALKGKLVAFCESSGAARRTVADLRHAADHPPSAYCTYWSSNANFG